jgi:hypothetical protein
LSSGLHSLLTNPSVPFFNLTTGIDELDKDEVVRDWLQKATTSMHDVLNQSNFQTQVHEVYQSETGRCLHDRKRRELQSGGTKWKLHLQ